MQVHSHALLKAFCSLVEYGTDLAALARAAPGRPQGGAALRLQGGSVDVHLTAAVLDVEPAGTLHAVCDGGGGEGKGLVIVARPRNASRVNGPITPKKS